MTLAAQAVAEYGGLSARSATNTLDNLMGRISTADAGDLLLVLLVVVAVIYLVSKLLDAA